MTLNVGQSAGRHANAFNTFLTCRGVLQKACRKFGPGGQGNAEHRMIEVHHSGHA